MIEEFFLENLFNLNKFVEEQYARIYLKKLEKNIGKWSPVKPKKEKFENILYINTLAGRGGAAKAAYDNLCRPLGKRRNYNTKMLVKNIHLETVDDNVKLAPRVISEEQNLLNDVQIRLGWQYFFQLGSFEIKNTDFFKQADILHLHNLHGGYFSPFAVPGLTALKPTVWTLHDEQSFTGHCAYSFECEKWQAKCGVCPDLKCYPEIETDSTSLILQTKRKIYENSHFTVICPSEWLKNKAEKSILKNKDIRKIYYGIDEKVFFNYDKEYIRKELNLPLDKKILMFSADKSLNNTRKGGYYIQKAYDFLKHREDLLFLAIGGEKTAYIEHNFLNIAYIYDETLMAKYYASSDLFIFPTLADNLPFVILESMSCATPVISFDIGGVPEELDHMKTGYLAKYKDIDDFIKGINIFLEDEKLRKHASIRAREVVEKNFTIDISLNNHEKLYDEIWERSKK